LGKRRRARKLQKGAPSDRPGTQAARQAPLTIPAATERLAVGAILFLGLVLRLAYLLEYRAKSVFYGQLMLDAQVYEDWARRIAAGEWLGGGVFYHAPLYPYLLALIFKAFGDRYLPIYLLQMLLGLTLLFLVYRIGRRCASSWIGLAAAGLLVLYAPLPFFETKVMSTSLGLFLSTLALAVLAEAWDKGGALPWLASGALIGIAALANPASLLLVPCYAAGLLLRKRRLQEVAALAAGAILAVAPATLHNLAQGGGFVLISSQGGITFYQGNTPTSRGLYRTVDGFTGSPLTQMAEEKAQAEKEVGHPLRASEVSSFWFAKGLGMVSSHPVAALNLMQMKLLRWFSSIEYSTEYSQSIEREQVATLWIPILPFGFLAVGGLAGCLLGYRAYPRLMPVYLYLVGTLAPPMLFYVSSRYRLPVVPALAILTATALERIVARLRSRGLLDALPAILIILIASALTLAPLGRDHLYQDANVHYNAGNLFYDRGEYDTAIEQYRQALQVSDFEYYRINLGNALTRKGRYEEAIEQYRLASQKKPSFAKSYIQWAKALALQGKLDEARTIYQRALQLKSRSSEVEAMLSGKRNP
jgi:4-amino-4-deoxy-L-arabinose transferase-like glycosyltransferase